MADYRVKVLAVKNVTHNVHAFTIEKPRVLNTHPDKLPIFPFSKTSGKPRNVLLLSPLSPIRKRLNSPSNRIQTTTVLPMNSQKYNPGTFLK